MRALLKPLSEVRSDRGDDGVLYAGFAAKVDDNYTEDGDIEQTDGQEYQLVVKDPLSGSWWVVEEHD